MKRSSQKAVVVRATQRRKRVLVALGYNDPQLQRGVAAYAHQAGWVLDVTMSRYGRLPTYWRGDGIITIVMPEQQQLSRWLCGQTIPVVSLNADSTPDIPGVVLDHQMTGRLVAEHYLDRGIRSLAFLRCSSLPDIRGREQGFFRAARSAKAACRTIDWGEAQRRGFGLDWLVQQLQELPIPVGIMSQSDHRAPELFAACEEARLSIPEQVLVIGVDNDTMLCEFAPVPLSSVDTNRGRLAWEGAALLQKLMSGKNAPKKPRVVTPIGIVPRKSSDLLAIRHSGVAAALSFMRERFGEPINVNDVVRKVPMSRCGLYRAFERQVGRSIGDELLRLRIEYSKRLLVTTDEKMYHIARQAGFASGEHFSKAFMRATGTTPSQYRRNHAVPQGLSQAGFGSESAGTR